MVGVTLVAFSILAVSHYIIQLQWNLSIADTLGTAENVLISEVSLEGFHIMYLTGMQVSTDSPNRTISLDLSN